MKYLIRKISQEDGVVFNFIDVAETTNETWARNIASSLNINMGGGFGVVPVEDKNENVYMDDGDFVGVEVEDDLDGDITVTIDGIEYPLFIDYFNTDKETGVRTYYAHYYKSDGNGMMFSECVPYTFTNKDMSNINR